VFPTPNNDAFLEHGVYQALDPAQQEIRLIRLYVDDDDDAPIRCDLLPPVPLASVQGKYTAVSYCAGDPGTTKTVLVNGIPFTVFANLAHVLDVARDFWHKSFPPNSNSTTENECILWADQISINQFDLAERSHQVGFMRSIYASAARTLICISTTRAVDTHGVEWLAALHASVDPDGDFYHYYYALEYHLRTKLAAASAAVRGGGRFAADWLALYDIFTSPWWTRTWVYQEFISSAEAHVLYGGASIAWRHVAEVLPTLRKYKVGTLAEPEVRETMAAVVDFFIRSKLRFDRAGPYELMDLLARSRHLRSTDCRDRVYAFLGLVRCDYGIVPDYSPNNTMASLLADMASKIVCRDQQLDILSYACEARGPLSGRLPSWAPDWTCTSCREIRSRTIEE
ncbi:heterokaryon incompatibility protein-domain-containing protein, partial [Lasiosphaeria miniovina]